MSTINVYIRWWAFKTKTNVPIEDIESCFNTDYGTTFLNVHDIEKTAPLIFIVKTPFAELRHWDDIKNFLQMIELYFTDIKLVNFKSEGKYETLS